MIVMAKTYEVEGRGAGAFEPNGSYRLLFEQNPQPMWVFDEETLAFLAVNDSALRHYGYTRDELLRMSVKDVRPSSELPGFLEFRSQLTLAFMEFGAPTQWTHQKKDGTLIDVECKGATIQFKNRPARLIIIEDITERKKTAERLRETADNFQIIFDAANEGIAIHDDERVLAGNSALAAMLGCSCEGCIGQSLVDLAAPESRYQVLSRLRTASMEPLEFSLMRTDGTRVRVNATSRVIRYQGRPARALLLRDISERVFAGFTDWLREPTERP